MRLILAFLLTLPAFAQQAPEQAKPAAPPAAEQAKPEAQPAGAAAKAEEKAASPAPATESWINGYIDLGYRFVPDVRGNFQQYRSVVNLGEGPKIFGVDFTIQDPKRRAFDTLTLRGAGWGGDPYTTAAVNARRTKLYDLRFDYRNIAYFNAIPSFANPNQPAGFNERSFDIRRRATSVQLDLFPASRIIPYLNYERNSGHGRGVETWVLGATDEFAVPYGVYDKTDSYRGGVRFEFNRFHLTLEEGGTAYKQDDGTNYTGPNPGDRTTPASGVTLNLATLYQAYRIRGTSQYSRALFTARPASWVNLYGQFLYSRPKSNVTYTEVATGAFFDFASQAAFPGLFNIGSGNAIQPHVTGTGGFELNWRRLRVIQSLTTDRFHDASFGLFSPQVFRNFLAGGSTSVAPRQVVNYNQSETDLIVDVTSKLSLRGGFRRTWGDATVLAGNLSQVGPSVNGEISRTVGLGGFSYRPSLKISVNGDYEGSSSDRIYFRASLNEYHRARLRARWQVTPSLLLQGNFRVLDNQNPAPDIRYDSRMHDVSLSVFWTPAALKRISLTGEWDRFTTGSDIRYVDLPFFTPAVSSYRDRAHTATAALDITLPMKGKLTAGGSLFVSEGSRPTRFYEPLARLALPLNKYVSWNSEWQYYGFGEQFFFFEAFRTHVFMTGLRVSR